MTDLIITSNDFDEGDSDGNYELQILVDEEQKQEIINAFEIVNRLPHIVAVMVQNAIDGCYDHIDDLETYFSGKRLELQKIRDGK